MRDRSHTRLWSLAVAALLVPSAANAQTLFSGYYEGGSNFMTAADVNLVFNQDGGFFDLMITNMGWSSEVFTRIGLVNTPAIDFITGGTVLGGNGAWSFEDNQGLTRDGIPDFVFAYNADRGINGGINRDETVSFRFFVDTSLYSFVDSWLDVGFGIHAQGGEINCSTKFGTWREDGVVTDNDGNYGLQGGGGPSYDPDCVAVPEPESGALLALGLLGLVFVAVRRRASSEVIEHA